MSPLALSYGTSVGSAGASIGGCGCGERHALSPHAYSEDWLLESRKGSLVASMPSPNNPVFSFFPFAKP